MPSFVVSNLVSIAALLMVACGGAGLAPTAGGMPSTAPASDGTTIQPGACDATPRALASMTGHPRAVASVGDSIYSTTNAGDAGAEQPAVTWRTTKGTNGVVRFADAARVFGMDRGNVVWADSDGERLRVSSPTGAATTDVGVSLRSFRGPYSTLEPLLADGELWVSAGAIGGGAFYGVPLAGGAPIERRLADRWVVATSWGHAGDTIVWTEGNGLWRGDGHAGVQVATRPGSIVRVGAGTAYVADGDTLTAVPLDGGPARTLAALTPDQPDFACKGGVGKYGVDRVIVGGDEQVYFSMWVDCLDGSFDHAIYRGGTSATRLAEYQDGMQLSLITSDDACLYWLTDSLNPVAATLWSVAPGGPMK